MYIFLIPTILGIIATALNPYGGMPVFAALISLIIPMILQTDINHAIKEYRHGVRPRFNATNRVKAITTLSFVLLFISLIVNTIGYSAIFGINGTIPTLEHSLTFYGDIFDVLIHHPNVCNIVWVLGILMDVFAKFIYWMEALRAMDKYPSVFL